MHGRFMLASALLLSLCACGSKFSKRFWPELAYNLGFTSVRAPIYGKVQEVVSGDTIMFREDYMDHDIVVRLCNIDCPDPSQPYAEEARKFTEDRILGKEVYINKMAHDRRGVVMALLYYKPHGEEGEDVMLNEELLREGYAWWAPFYCNVEDWKELFIQVGLSGKGIWKDGFDPKNAPWEFRQRQLRENRPPECCKVCDWPNRACGGACINLQHKCHKREGCACDAF